MKYLTFLLFVLLAKAAHAYDLDTYLEVLKKNSVTTLDQAVSHLPVHIRSSFTLMHQGHGLRTTNFMEPAAILFDIDGSFFVNIGSPNQSLGNEIEIAQYSKAEKKVELYSLKFPLEHDAHGNILRPKPNPSECLQCHGNHPRLLWGTYPSWPGAYGSGVHDALKRYEKKELQEFIQNYSHQGPYRFLIFGQPNHYGTGVDSAPLAKRPNTLLTFLSLRINAAVIARRLELSPQYEKLRHELLASLLSCFIVGEQTRLIKILSQFDIDQNELAPASDGVPYYEKFSLSEGLNTFNNILANNLITNLIKNNKDPDLAHILVTKNLEETFGKEAELQAFDKLGAYVANEVQVCKYLKKILKTNETQD